MIRQFFKFCYWLTGWKVVGSKPDLKKYVLIVAPHTSNWDFFVGLAARSIAGIKSRFLIKNSITNIPVIGSVVRAMGGRGVDRSKPGNLVDQVVEMFSQEEDFTMTITPEGTRSYNPDWKTGFYRIADKAKVPIVIVGFDYSRKIVEFKEVFYTTGDMEKDIEHIKAYYRTIKGRHPEKGVK